MRNLVTAVVVGLGTLVAAAPAQASWLSEALRNTHVNVNLGPSYGPAYGPGYYAVPVAPPCVAPAYVVPTYVVPGCGHTAYPVRPVYPSYRGRNHHGHHH